MQETAGAGRRERGRGQPSGGAEARAPDDAKMRDSNSRCFASAKLSSQAKSQQLHRRRKRGTFSSVQGPLMQVSQYWCSSGVRVANAAAVGMLAFPGSNSRLAEVRKGERGSRCFRTCTVAGYSGDIIVYCADGVITADAQYCYGTPCSTRMAEAITIGGLTQVTDIFISERPDDLFSTLPPSPFELIPQVKFLCRN